MTIYTLNQFAELKGVEPRALETQRATKKGYPYFKRGKYTHYDTEMTDFIDKMHLLEKEMLKDYLTGVQAYKLLGFESSKTLDSYRVREQWVEHIIYKGNIYYHKDFIRDFFKIREEMRLKKLAEKRKRVAEANKDKEPEIKVVRVYDTGMSKQEVAYLMRQQKIPYAMIAKVLNISESSATSAVSNYRKSRGLK